MTTLRQSVPAAPGRSAAQWWVVAALGLVAVIVIALPPLRIGAFPEAWNIHLRNPIDSFESWVIGHRTTHPVFVYILQPFTHVVDSGLRLLEKGLLATPWPVLLAALAFLAYRTTNRTLTIFSVLAVFSMGLVGLWSESIQTLSLMAFSVGICLLIGLPLGVVAARYGSFYRFLRPILDAMQTMPSFVYLIPVLLFFGVARVPSVVATVIYALPPLIRFTASGIRQVPAETIEAADVFGSTGWQKLVKVQLPLAMPSILAGVNQTIMMALGMVVIAALIGAAGLGREVLLSLQRLRVGQGLEAGLAIVLMAMILDRISQGLAPREPGTTSLQTGRFRAVPPILRHYVYWAAATLVILYLLVVHAYVVDLSGFPEDWRFSIREPVDAAVRWMRDNLYQIGELPIGTGPFSDFLITWLLNPLRSLLQSWLPWPVVVLATGLIGYLSSGWRLGLFMAGALFATGLLGLWAETMDTLSQVLVAVAVSLVIGFPLGVWSARNDTLRTTLRPILDFLQTIPVFVYLVPVIMLFNVGRVPGIMASVLYAIPPLVRLTDLGIRRVDREAIDACEAFGSTPWQRLRKVELPLAMPTIMLGVNQTVVLVLAMVCIAGLVGGGALGFEAINGLAKSELGRGIEAGLAIVLLAMVLDRLTQAWAHAW